MLNAGEQVRKQVTGVSGMHNITGVNGMHYITGVNGRYNVAGVMVGSTLQL